MQNFVTKELKPFEIELKDEDRSISPPPPITTQPTNASTPKEIPTKTTNRQEKSLNKMALLSNNEEFKVKFNQIKSRYNNLVNLSSLYAQGYLENKIENIIISFKRFSFILDFQI